MKEYIAKQGFTGTGNLAIRREVFEDVGPFGGLHIAEDRDWGQRALAKGYKTTYVDHMKVYHPARKSFGELVQKWNRHIAHDYEKIGKKPGGRLRWLGRSVAVLGSPVFELGRILTSDRISGMNDRLKALGILLRIRLYRGGQMLRVLTASDPQAESSGWNRG
jgi:GT2 family glycosyltransferase